MIALGTLFRRPFPNKLSSKRTHNEFISASKELKGVTVGRSNMKDLIFKQMVGANRKFVERSEMMY